MVLVVVVVGGYGGVSHVLSLTRARSTFAPVKSVRSSVVTPCLIDGGLWPPVSSAARLQSLFTAKSSRKLAIKVNKIFPLVSFSLPVYMK